MTQMLELLNREFKAIVTNMVKVLLEIMHNIHNQIGRSANVTETIRNSQMEKN